MQAIVHASVLVGLGSTAAALVVVPVAMYTLFANPALRTFRQGFGVALCGLPILGMIASVFLGRV